MTIDLEKMGSLDIFHGLGHTELADISHFLHTRNAARGEVLLFEGDPTELLYVVLEGVVKVYKTSSDGKEQILYLVRPGETVNDVPVSGQDVNLASAEAMGPATVLGMKGRDLKAMFAEHPVIAANVLEARYNRVKHLSTLVEDFSFRNVTGRVAKVLLEHAGDDLEEKPKLTQQEIAAMIGTAREMVGRALKTLEEDGQIRFDRHRIVITDEGALKTAAGLNL